MSPDSICTDITNKLNTGILIIDNQYNIVFWNRYLEIHAIKKMVILLARVFFKYFLSYPKNGLKEKLKVSFS